jgi:hypothetical protein
MVAACQPHVYIRDALSNEKSGREGSQNVATMVTKVEMPLGKASSISSLVHICVRVLCPCLVCP